jgi:Smg protein
VFTKVENFYFTKEMKSIILKLNAMGILTADELEIIIFRMSQLAAANNLETDLVWEIINEVVDDSESLMTISAEFKEFNSGLLKQQRVN